MRTIPSPATITRLEKAAVDNGFDQELPRDGGWLGFASTHSPLRIWLTVIGDGAFLAAFSQLQVARALSDHGTAMTSPLPQEACAARVVADIPALHRLVRRAFQLSKTLPDELLHAFEKQTATLPRTTEVERLVVQRVGQDLFRAGLLEYWEGRCAVTGLAIPELLRASHIKRWSDCASDKERLDVFNGLLLAPHLDAAFDRGFMTVSDEGSIVASAVLSIQDRKVLGVDGPLKVARLTERHRQYLSWHRVHVFKNSSGDAGTKVP